LRFLVLKSPPFKKCFVALSFPETLDCSGNYGGVLKINLNTPGIETVFENILFAIYWGDLLGINNLRALEWFADYLDHPGVAKSGVFY
jgi:hypothetical protein